MKAFAALRLPPLVLATCCLLAVPLLVFSQVGGPTDRYSLSRPGTGATHGWTYYGCARPEIIYGNNRIAGLKAARAEARENAKWNMRAIDQFDPPPTPPPIPKTKKQALKQVPEWIQFGVELTVHTIDRYRNYDRDEIMANIDAFYDDKINRTDAYLQDVTKICAEDQNDASRSNDP
ncbi:MAG: hypothetical protein OXI17_13005 [Gammaproteobacteria bacterium]|nr:hypothetical protein [Gammaproteobacteria bacterium]